MKLGQKVCLDEIRDELKNGPCWVKKYITRSNLRKWVISGRKVDHLLKILEKPCVCPRGYIFSLIIMKHGQNVCLDEVSDEFKNGSCWVKN